MHINTMRAGLEQGKSRIGAWLTMVRNPAILSLMQSADLDFARVDMEHTALTIEHIADLAVLARALNFPIAVRPPGPTASGSRRCWMWACGTSIALRWRTRTMRGRSPPPRGMRPWVCVAMAV